MEIKPHPDNKNFYGKTTGLPKREKAIITTESQAERISVIARLPFSLRRVLRGVEEYQGNMNQLVVSYHDLGYIASWSLIGSHYRVSSGIEPQMLDRNIIPDLEMAEQIYDYFKSLPVAEVDDYVPGPPIPAPR